MRVDDDAGNGEACAAPPRSREIGWRQLIARTPSRALSWLRALLCRQLALEGTDNPVSSMQKARRHDPYPWTWEVPLLVFVVLMLGLAVGVQVGRSLANLLAGAGWTWAVDQATFWRSIPAVAGGDAGAGLGTGTSGPRLDGGLASPVLVWTGIGIVEVLVLVAAGWAAIWGLQRWGPGRLKGMATRPEAEQMLGLTRLRKVSSIVRPDLYGKHLSARQLHGPVTTAGERAASTLGRGMSSPLLPERMTGLTGRAGRRERNR